MAGILLTFVGGIAATLRLAALPSALAITLTALLGATFLFWGLCEALRVGGWRTRSRAAAWVGALLLGVAWGCAAGAARLAQRWPADRDGETVTLSGTVVGLPFETDSGWRFEFVADGVPQRFALQWARPPQSSPPPAPGQRWRLALRLRTPHGHANPRGRDEELAWLAHGIDGLGRVVGIAQPLADPVPLRLRFAVSLDRLRAALAHKIRAAAPAQTAGVLVALVVGDQRGIGDVVRERFAQTGTSHLLAISGMHLTLVAQLVGAVAGRLWRRGRLPLIVAAPRIETAAGVIAALGYGLLAGAQVPVRRAAVMQVAAACGASRLGSPQRLLLALAAVVTAEPWALLAPGFWLSFGAVAAIHVAQAARADTGRSSVLRIQLAVTGALVPATLALFARLSWVSPLANLVAIPLAGTIATPLALAGALLPAPWSTWLLGAAAQCLALLARWLDLFAAAGVWVAAVPSAAATGLAVFGVLWLIAPGPWRCGLPSRWLSLPLLLPALTAGPEPLAPGEFRVVALDVGQGSAVVVETASQRLLFDTGPDPRASVVSRYLSAFGLNRLDRVVVSHQDGDHANGAVFVLEHFGVGELVASLPPGHPLWRQATRARQCLAGDGWDADGVRFRWVFPRRVDLAHGESRPNARSCVLRIDNGRVSALLTGDIEAAQEDFLSNFSDKKLLMARLLLVPHHGSRTSSTPGFVAAVAPEVAWIQAGFGNRYGHPAPEIVARYRAHGSTVGRTDLDGALRFDSAGAGFRIAAWRREHRRYWMAADNLNDHYREAAR